MSEENTSIAIIILVVFFILFGQVLLTIIAYLIKLKITKTTPPSPPVSIFTTDEITPSPLTSRNNSVV